ncbi:MAG: hypothetical protein H2174_00045 [Vampirovibrio sp.]|nr:hypothetical protein [Vampirovibrio sp.]
MAGVNPVSTYNPALLQQQQQAMAMGQQPTQPQVAMPMATQPTTSGGEGMTDLQQALAGANSLAVEGTTKVAPQVLAMAQQSAQVSEVTKANDQLKQQNLALQAQIQATTMKGQQQGVQEQALQQLQTTIPTMPQTQATAAPAGVNPTTVMATVAQQPVVASTGNSSLSDKQSAAILSGNLGEFGKSTAENALSGWKDVQKKLEEGKQMEIYRNALMAQGITKDQATALANQKIQADNAAATGQAVVAQQPIMVQQQPQQPVVQAPVAAQPVQQPTIQPPVATDTTATSPAPTPTAPVQEEMVNVAGVGLVSKATLTAVLQNTSPEAQEAQAQAKAQEQAQQQAQQQQPASTVAATPRAVLPADYTIQQALPQTTLMPQQQALTGFPPVASPLAFASVNSFGNSGITAEKYQQLLAYMNQQQQPAVASTNTPSTSATSSAEADSFAKAKIEAAKLGFDTTNMPNNYAELRVKQQKRRKIARQKNLESYKKPYLPKPENKYDFYGSGEAST